MIPPQRMIFDILTLARASGHPDGIVRASRALARYASTHRRDVVFAIYDLEINALRAINPQWLPAILAGAKIETSHFPDPRSRQRLRQSLPKPLGRLMFAIQRPRRTAYMLLERVRLRAGRRAVWATRFQDRIVSSKYVAELSIATGERRMLIPYTMAVGAPLTLDENDTIIETGSDWPALEALAKGFERSRCRLVVLCYDIIPLLFPQFFIAATAQTFRHCFEALFPASNLVIFIAEKNAADARAYCASRGIAMGRHAVVQLGTDVHPAADAARGPLPAGLVANRYALFVSTIEPRKNHRLLYAVWKRLLAEGVPQQHGFKLVFVGRRGWLSDDLLRELDADPCVGDSLLLLSGIDDVGLAALYAQAAFCLYPSVYEGFGLPIIESFANGKAVLASGGGALAETVGALSPVLDPQDEDAWLAAMKRWLAEPEARAPFERAIARGFRQRTWDEAAGDFFDAIDQQVGARASQETPHHSGSPMRPSDGPAP